MFAFGVSALCFLSFCTRLCNTSPSPQLATLHSQTTSLESKVSALASKTQARILAKTRTNDV